MGQIDCEPIQYIINVAYTRIIYHNFFQPRIFFFRKRDERVFFCGTLHPKLFELKYGLFDIKISLPQKNMRNLVKKIDGNLRSKTLSRSREFKQSFELNLFANEVETSQVSCAFLRYFLAKSALLLRKPKLLQLLHRRRKL